MHLEYDEYVSILSLLGCLAAGHLFCCLVVFQFRKNLMEEISISNAVRTAEDGALHTHLELILDQCVPNVIPILVTAELSRPYAPRAPSPPPTYEEVSKTVNIHETKDAASAESPPEYASAIANMNMARKRKVLVSYAILFMLFYPH